jgi:hypothetical protein
MPKVNKFDAESLVSAVAMVEEFLKSGHKAWRVSTVVYWIEDSTD